MSSSITLELGDIIEIYSPNDIQYHEKVFIIHYIDSNLIKITSINDGFESQFSLNDGKLDNIHIEHIILFDRNEKKGFVKQNDLDVGKWVNVHFGGDYPTILTGQITNNEEDMIEITTYPDLQTIYIDFEYKGVPQNIPFKHIEIREPPQEYVEKTTLDKIEQEQQEQREQHNGPPIEDKDDIEYSTPLSVEENDSKNHQEELNDLYTETNEIIFGEKLETLKQVVEVPEHEKRYTIELQLNDMMDVFLSTIPNEKRTQTLMKNVHLLITRFKELRETFSVFSSTTNTITPNFYGPNHKPLIDVMKSMNKKLKWLLPVVKHNKYVIMDDDTGDVDINIQYRKTKEAFEQLQTMQLQYKKDEPYKRDAIALQVDAHMSSITEPDNKSNVKMSEVNAGIEAIVDNLNDFNSNVLMGNDNLHIKRKQYVIDVYGLGSKKSVASQTDNKVNILVNNTPNDKMYVKSFLYLPYPFIEQSKVYLDKQNMLERVKTHQQLLMYSRLFNSATNIINNVVDNLDEDLNHESLEMLSQLNTFSLNEMSTNVDKNVRFDKFYESIVPKTKTLIHILRNQLKKKYSFVSVVNELEPFNVFQKDITYTQHNSIRYTVKENIKEFKKQMVEVSQLFSNYKNNRQIHEGITKNPVFLEALLNTQAKQIMDNYVLPTENINASEQMRKIYKTDNGKLLYNFVSNLMFALNVPAKLNILEEEEKNSKNPLRIKSDCSRRYLSKKYNSVDEMMLDNNKENIYFDKEYDDTPYDIMDQYQTEKRNMLNEEFHEFLKEVLVQKHDVQKDYVDTLAKTLIEGKKQVNNEDYALVVDNTSSNTSEYVVYYKRVKNNWVRDDTVSDPIFMDNNTLFCNIQNQCVKNKMNQMCQSTDQMRESLQHMRKEELLQELETRYQVNMEDLKAEIENNLNEYQRFMKKQIDLNEVLEYKANNLWYHLGLMANKDLSIKSPHSNLLQKIISTSDFTTKIQNIILFNGVYCREPIESTNENLYWKYCITTNVKLLPSFLYELANAYIVGNYEETLFEIIRKQGVESDDGDSIVDIHSGMIITPRTFDTEEGFDSLGFKVSSRSFMEQEISQLPEERKLTRDEQRIFENPNMEKVYKVFEFLTQSMDIDGSQFDLFCLRLSLNLVESLIVNEEKYNAIVSKQKEKNPDKKMAKYNDYFNESLIMIVSGCYLISVQTAIPSVKAKKTFPGCVKSFMGYPFSGEEDMSGIQYISCILYKTRSSVEPWSAVKKYNSIDKFEKNIRKIIDKNLISHIEVMDRIKQKKQYLLLNKDEDYEIKEQHRIQRWLSFQPPLVTYELKEEQKENVSSEFMKELLSTIQKGDKSQVQMLNTMLSKNQLLSYALVNEINAEVKKEVPVMKTFGGIPFVDNACCQDIIKNPMKYFANKNGNISIYLTNILKNETFIDSIKTITSAPTLYHPYSTRTKNDVSKQGHYEENIYGYIIHYCNFDKPDKALDEYMSICGEIPKSYQPDMNIEEKMAVLKRNGKNYTLDTLFGLMKMINKRNTITPYIQYQHQYKEHILAYLDEIERSETSLDESPLIESNLAELLRKLIALDSYQYEETQEMNDLKNYLLMTTSRMNASISGFIRQYTSINKKQLDSLLSFIASLREQNMWEQSSQENYHKTSYLMNFLHYISKFLPQILLSNRRYVEISPKHWGLSREHSFDVKYIVESEYSFIKDVIMDDTMVRYFNVLEKRIDKIYTFAKLFPYAKYEDKYLLLDTRAQELFLSYCIYSVIHEYIILTDDIDITEIHKENKKKDIRMQNAMTESDTIESTYQEDSDDVNGSLSHLDEVDIITGNIDSLKKNVSNIIVAMLNKGISDKKILNINYDTIMKKTKQTKELEKSQIIKEFAKMSIEARKIENEHKKYKLGKWNVGQQKGLVHYDKNTYDRERLEMRKWMSDSQFEQENEDNEAVNNAQTTYDIDDLEQHDNDLNNQLQDSEAYDISHLGENFMDGNYYPEDQDE